MANDEDSLTGHAQAHRTSSTGGNNDTNKTDAHDPKDQDNSDEKLSASNLTDGQSGSDLNIGHSIAQDDSMGEYGRLSFLGSNRDPNDDTDGHGGLIEDHFTLGLSSFSLPEFTQDSYPLQAMIVATNKVFYDMGARSNVLGTSEYEVIKEVMDSHSVEDWCTLQNVITQEREQRELVDALTHVFTDIFWKERPPQDCVRTLILISFVESMYILGQQAFEFDHKDNSETPHQRAVPHEGVCVTYKKKAIT